MKLFESLTDGTFNSRLAKDLPDLAQQLSVLLENFSPSIEQPPVYSDPGNQEIWNAVYAEAYDEQLQTDFQLAAIVVSSSNLSRPELESLSRALNVIRIEHYQRTKDTRHPLYEVLSGIVSEATDALLGEWM